MMKIDTIMPGPAFLRRRGGQHENAGPDDRADAESMVS